MSTDNGKPENQVTYTPGAPEPETVTGLVNQMKGAMAADDRQLLLGIYAEFKWELKKLGMVAALIPVQQIHTLLDNAIKRVKKEIRTEALRAGALVKFEGAKEQIKEDSKLCEIHGIPKLICPCLKS